MKTLGRLLPLFLLASCAGEAPDPAPEWPIPCSVFPDRDAAVAACARRGADGEIVLRPGVVGGEQGPEAVVVEGELYFALPSGKTAPALLYDNGPDYFVEGLARTVRDGKVGFVNEELEVVVPREWDFAFPCEDGVARVCTGCSVAREEGGEHGIVQGGTWGVIDREGRVVVPVVHDRDDLPAGN